MHCRISKDDTTRQAYLRRVAAELATRLPEDRADAYSTIDLMKAFLDEWIFADGGAGAPRNSANVNQTSAGRLTLIE